MNLRTVFEWVPVVVVVVTVFRKLLMVLEVVVLVVVDNEKSLFLCEQYFGDLV
jgi:hypothetical protein